MKFDELDEQMRVYETLNDQFVLPGLYIVARIDGRSFTRLTKELHNFEAPFDTRVRDMMVETTAHVMQCGFRAVYGYTQSDEISILFDLDEQTFSRKLRKWNSVLAGEASAKFTHLLGDLAAFDCRVSQLPSLNRVVDYFMWRSEDAHRNALNGHCYWTLRKKGQNERQATDAILRLSVAQKNELLFAEGGLNFNDVPTWQKRGVGLYWETYEKDAQNPKTGEPVVALRRRLKRDLELPMKDAYASLVRHLATKPEE